MTDPVPPERLPGSAPENLTSEAAAISNLTESSAAVANRAGPARSGLNVRVLAGAVVLGVSYAVMAKAVALITAFGNTTGATFWPGAGLTVAVLLWRPRAEWPYYLVAVAVAEATVDLSEGFGLAVSLGWAVANTAEPFAAAWLLTRRGPWRADRLGRRDLLPFVLAALVAGPVVGALVGTAVGVLSAGDPWLPRFPRWYVGDAIGVLVVAPVLLTLHGGRWRLEAQAVAWFLVLALVSLLALGPWAFAGADGLPFLTLPLLIVIALRYGIRGAAVGVLIVAMIVEAVTAGGAGPFAGSGAFHGLVVAQMFVAMSAVTAQTVAVLTGELVSREQLDGQLRELALRDSLTGLANRRLLFDRIEHASERLARKPGVLALLFIDLDGFKSVNDTHGHGAGDAVLIEAADRLRSIVRDHDSVARLGGDEFLVFAEDVAATGDALTLAARIIAAFDEPFALQDANVHVSASIGIAVTSTPIADPGAYITTADHAMYAAKRAGGRRSSLSSHVGPVQERGTLGFP